MKKKILYVIPDYSYATLNSLSIFKNTDKFEITVVAPYNINLVSNRFLRKIRTISRRMNDWKNFSGFEIKIISNNPIKLLFSLWQYYRKYRIFNLTNILKRNLELLVIKKIDFSKYDILFSFDGVSLVYQKKAKEFGLKTIMEARGNHIDVIAEINSKINERYGSNLPVKDDPGETWFDKLRNEVYMADYIITYSEFQTSQFQLRLKSEHQMVYKIPILSKFQFYPNSKEYKQSLKFLFIGNQSVAKGVEGLKNIWEKIHQELPSNVSLAFIGNIPSDNIQDAAQMRTEYLGYFQAEDLKRYLKEHDVVLILPSFYESYGMVILESLAYCIPVITNSNCGASDLIENDINGWIYNDPFDFESLGNLIKRIAKHPAIAREKSLNILRDYHRYSYLTERVLSINYLVKSIIDHY